MSYSPMFLDIETNGLDPDTIWVAVTMQDNAVQVHYDKDSLAKALQGDFPVVGHNLIGFDLPVLEKLWGILVDKRRVQDTLVMSRLANPQREGGHRLAVWGGKGDHDDWSCLSKDMVDYCVQDVRVTAKAYSKIKLELRWFTQDSIDLEHEVQWIVQEQVRNGWLLDMRHAIDLLATLKERKLAVEDEVHKVFKPKWVDVKQVVPKTKKDGSLSKVGLTDEEYQKVQQSGDRSPFMRRALKPFNLGSRQQIGEYLIDFGWKPCKLTPTGQPMVDEAVLSTVKDIPQAAMIAEYLMLQKRVAQVQSWVDEANPDTDRVHGYVNTNGAVTGRMTHSKPNLAQVPASYSPYGKECRQCWIARDGYKLVGFDASGLELRMLAHYMDDKEYTNEVINGDIHTANQHLAGLESRDQAKTFIYALIYGAGNEKLGTVVGGNKSHGKRLRESFLNNLPAFAALAKRVERASAKGYVRGLDGRKIFIRSSHAALNSLLQGAGAIVMKKALVLFDDKLKSNNLNAKIVANIHDEWQVEALAQDAELVGELGIDAIVEAGVALELNCQLDGEYNVGDDWSETH